jgi:large subunit ribosomal protein L3
MGRKNGPRHGSMQIWPRSRSNDFLPRVNWVPILANSTKFSNSSQKTNLLGFIGYKVGMASAFLKDNTPDSMMKGKRVVVPVTIIECPTIKIFSVRFYKNTKVSTEILNDNLDKDLKKVVKVPTKKGNAKEALDKIKIDDFDDVQVIVYSEIRQVGIKKTPDLAELALSGSKNDKMEFIKANIAKAFSITDCFQKGIIDIHALTKGKGFQGPVKRFGIDLRSHKAEKGQRRPGSIGPWHPTGVPFTVARAGQLGLFKRISYNSPIISSKKLSDSDALKTRVFDNYGMVKADYLILAGSVHGSQKRPMLITAPLRPTKRQLKRQYELIELR